MQRSITAFLLAVSIAGSTVGMFVPGAGGDADRDGKNTDQDAGPVVVSRDDPWYEKTEVVLFGESDMSSYDRVSFESAGLTDGGYSFTADGRRTPPSDEDRSVSGYDLSEYYFREVFTYSPNGDIISIGEAADATAADRLPQDLLSDAEVLFTLYDGEAVYHIVTGISEDGIGQVVLFIEDYSRPEEDGETQDEGPDPVVVLLGCEDATRISGRLMFDNRTPVSSAYFFNGDIFLDAYDGSYLYDKDTNEMIKIDCEGNISAIDRKGVYVVTPKGIGRYDIRSGEVTGVLDLNDCDISRSDLSGMYVVDVREDGFILADTGSDDILRLVSLMPAESNPNAGKTLLTISSAEGEISCGIADLVYDYNSGDNEAFIRITDTDDEGYADIMTGTFGTGITEDADEGTFRDLSDIAEGNLTAALLDPDGEDDILSLPLAVSPEGIFASGIDSGIAAEDGRTGFSYDEYDEAVRTSFDGVDPLGTGSREDYFAEGFLLCRDLFYNEDGELDDSGEAFSALIDYCTSVSPGEATSAGTSGADPLGDRNSINIAAGRLSGTDMLIDRFGASCVGVRCYGTPSFDGRGPALIVGESISVLSAADGDAVLSFIGFILNDRSGKLYDDSCAIPAYRDALDRECAAAAERYNAMLDRYALLLDPQGSGAVDLSEAVIDPEGLAENIVAVIDSCGILLPGSSASFICPTGGMSFPSVPVRYDAEQLLDEEVCELWSGVISPEDQVSEQA